MASDRQIRANRENAKLSTGPRTLSGKAAVAGNALRHGLAAHQIVLRDENPVEFEALRQALTAELFPESALEGLLVDRLAGLFWRLRRIPHFEAALLSSMHERQDERRNATRVVLGGVVISCESSDATEPYRRAEALREQQSRQETGRALVTLLIDGDVLNKLGRYERELMRQVERVLAELGRCRGHVAFARLLARRAE